MVGSACGLTFFKVIQKNLSNLALVVSIHHSLSEGVVIEKSTY